MKRFIGEVHGLACYVEPEHGSYADAAGVCDAVALKRCDTWAGCLDIVYVPEIANRRQGLEWLGLLGKGQHLERSITHLRKARAMIIEPHSSGGELC